MAGRRDSHKQSTRQALEDAALHRFARDGYDETSVDAIAADAGVSTRTFFRYFATKDEVLALGRDERQATLRHRIRVLAAEDVGDLAVVRGALVELAAGFEADRERVGLRQQAAERSAVVRGRLFDAFVSWEQVVAGELVASGRGDQARAQTLAAVGLGVFRAAVGRWLTEGGSLPSQVEAGFDAVG